MLDDLRLLIKPKVPIENLFYLMGYRPSLIDWSDLRFPYEQDPDLLGLLAWLFEAEVAAAMPQGLSRDYVTREEALRTLRGRIDIAGQQRRQVGRPLPLECRYDEYTEDTALNRMLKAAHREALVMRGLDRSVGRRLRAWHRAFTEVADVAYSSGTVPDPGFTRLNEHWQPAAHIAHLLLRHEAIRDSEGHVIGSSFTVDMNALFEKFIEEILVEEARAAGLSVVPQARRFLTELVPMKPDLLLQEGGRDAAVGDAKYKRLDIAEMPNADLYQLLAYCSALGLDRGLLIYATTEVAHHQIVRRAGTELWGVGVDLSLGRNELVEDARRAVRILVAQAKAHALEKVA